MSHTTAIKSIAITSIPALRKAVEFLQSKGIKCSLRENDTPRAYYSNQAGMGKADFVLKLDASRYDVGFYKGEDGKYEARTDFWQGDVERVLGVPATAETRGSSQHQLGRLFQAYAMCATEEQVRKQGYMVTRQFQTNGDVKLVVNGY